MTEPVGSGCSTRFGPQLQLGARERTDPWSRFATVAQLKRGVIYEADPRCQMKHLTSVGAGETGSIRNRVRV